MAAVLRPRAISERTTRCVEGVRPETIAWRELIDAGEPVLLKGVARDWPLVQAGLQSAAAAIDYLRPFYNGRTVGTYLGPPGIHGRYFYDEALTGLNFVGRRLPLDQVLEQIRSHLDDVRPPSIYVGSTTIDACLPGLREHNDLPFNDPMFAAHPPLASIWIGNPSTASAHYDVPINWACCAVGERRFTLFPPDQVANLYPGPLELTPGGQVVSLVDFSAPDLERFPRFAEAMAHAQVAEMAPGDVLFYPSLWWHHVQAFSPFNVLINYWWNPSPRFLDAPTNVLHHALLGLRDRPQAEKDAWRALFDYYVFGPSERAAEHLPAAARGVLATLDADTARNLRVMLLEKLNR